MFVVGQNWPSGTVEVPKKGSFLVVLIQEVVRTSCHLKGKTQALSIVFVPFTKVALHSQDLGATHEMVEASMNVVGE